LCITNGTCTFATNRYMLGRTFPVAEERLV
jgi:hypothetical protein